MEQREYYQILGVDRNADESTIKKAYKKLAIQFHPDRNPDNQEAENRFKEAAEAYQVLSDPDKRATYDRFGHDGLRGQGYQGFSGFDDIFSSMGNIFEDLFGGFGGSQRRADGPRRGRDLRYDLEIELEEAAFGTEKSIEIQKYASCLTCTGSGLKPGTSPTTCPTCMGSGQIRRTSGFFSIQTTCSQCGGNGRIIQYPCDQCNGSGQVIESSQINVKIPAGIDSGVKMRIAGKGEEGHKNGPPGDLYVVIYLRPHEIFERHGNDLALRLPISIAQAAVGAQINVPSLDGDLIINVPKGSQNHDIVRTKGKGVPLLKGYGRGDLLVEINIVVPKKITKRQEELLKEFQQIEDNKRSSKSDSFLKKIKSFATGE